MSWSYRDAHDDFPEPDSRDCSKCIHRISPNAEQYSGCIKGCELWECCFEEKEPMTLEDAIEIIKNIDWSKADEGKDELEVEKEDEAFDLVIAKAKAYMKRDCAEWVDWVDGQLGVKTEAGTCSKCGAYNRMQTTFCPHCGRQMKNVKSTNPDKKRGMNMESKYYPKPDPKRVMRNHDNSIDALFDEALDDLAKKIETGQFIPELPPERKGFEE